MVECTFIPTSIVLIKDWFTCVLSGSGYSSNKFERVKIIHLKFMYLIIVINLTKIYIIEY